MYKSTRQKYEREKKICSVHTHATNTYTHSHTLWTHLLSISGTQSRVSWGGITIDLWFLFPARKKKKKRSNSKTLLRYPSLPQLTGILTLASMNPDCKSRKWSHRHTPRQAGMCGIYIHVGQHISVFVFGVHSLGLWAQGSDPAEDFKDADVWFVFTGSH